MQPEQLIHVSLPPKDFNQAVKVIERRLKQEEHYEAVNKCQSFRGVLLREVREELMLSEPMPNSTKSN